MFESANPLLMLVRYYGSQTPSRIFKTRLGWRLCRSMCGKAGPFRLANFKDLGYGKFLGA